MAHKTLELHARSINIIFLIKDYLIIIIINKYFLKDILKKSSEMMPDL
jgi:hypothetical protein